MKATYHFPPDFLWGVATSSHQVEGNNTNNQWWLWEQEEGHIAEGHKSGPACNWWANAEADFDVARDMGLNALRLSVEWSRIEIAPGRIDTAALDRYREMVHGLRERGMEPMVTLHHFTEPIWFAEQGGWLNQHAVAYFVRYVEQVVRALKDEVTLWCTINEPNVYAALGYLTGEFPPGERNPQRAFRVLHKLLQAHAAAYRRIHQLQAEAQVGLAHNFGLFDPYQPRRWADRLVARWYDRSYNGVVLRPPERGWWQWPVGLGPEWGVRRTLDWIGLNYYTRYRVAFDRHAEATPFGRMLHTPGAEMMDGDYGELYPEGLARAVLRLWRMRLPIYVTENGLPDADDDMRPRAILLHLHQLWRVMQGNVPVRGYFHWTLTDNFEWAKGWTLRFGLIGLDPQTQERHRRASADLYAAIVQAGAIVPEVVEAYVPTIRDVLYPS